MSDFFSGLFGDIFDDTPQPNPNILILSLEELIDLNADPVGYSWHCIRCLTPNQHHDSDTGITACVRCGSPKQWSIKLAVQPEPRRIETHG